MEVVVVDDGSSDNTLEIANKYQKKFPDIVKVVHQENGGHGEAVNTGSKMLQVFTLKFLIVMTVLEKMLYRKSLIY